ncbi:oxidoreductase [Zavarzinia compransoris]|uniref:Short-chain dehydrogenase n=1 Tax=Zavarzinia compransoris TaxID=1264899 RepID=A0A317DX04_9PROT|nr:oxidoreductase [Zavarzinia compransoris]PWR19051.1 short-chain dehydrogenase [Zavarzinia compransoris]TDP49058.1 NAD(P)-dependent dehydrogenase (short-subunit alcohol dehydrogenase family) [Zavarzinia compransoris]
MAWNINSVPDQTGRTAVVTGANSGLGYHTANALAARGARVILACRNREKAEAAVAAIRANHPGARAEFRPLDLADLKSVEAFAATLGAELPALDLLVNNAGVMALPLVRTRDGFEMQVGTNHLGHFALTGRLLPLLDAAPAARIVTVASLAHKTGTIDLNDLNWEQRRYSKWPAYGQAKLANLVFAHELHRRLAAAGRRTVSIAAHPGFAATNLLMAGPRMENSLLGKVAMAFGGAAFAQSADRGAIPILHAATAPDVAGGSYWGPDGTLELWGRRAVPAQAAQKARDPETGRRLWVLSESLTAVAYLG